MENWRRVFRDGVCPNLTGVMLAALETGLAADDVALMQGCTVSPPPLQCMAECEVAGACLLTYAGWKGMGFSKVYQAEDWFAWLCHQTDVRMNEPAAYRYVSCWWDDTPRDEARRLVLEEVRREIARRLEPDYVVEPVTDDCFGVFAEA